MAIQIDVGPRSGTRYLCQDLRGKQFTDEHHAQESIQRRRPTVRPRPVISIEVQRSTINVHIATCFSPQSVEVWWGAQVCDPEVRFSCLRSYQRNDSTVATYQLAYWDHSCSMRDVVRSLAISDLPERVKAISEGAPPLDHPKAGGNRSNL